MAARVSTFRWILLTIDWRRLPSRTPAAQELVDSVKTVALRWGRASYLSEDPLKRAIKKLGEGGRSKRVTQAVCDSAPTLFRGKAGAVQVDVKARTVAFTSRRGPWPLRAPLPPCARHSGAR